MCRYHYGNGLCANNSIEDAECIGLDQCSERFPVSSGAFEISSEQSCGYDKWYGLYCDKYKRFFCAGRGNCENFEEYIEHFASHISNAKGPGLRNEMQI